MFTHPLKPVTVINPPPRPPGVGADDTFIFCKVWERCKSDKNAGTLAKLVGDSLRQAALSMLVTSLTTAAAFFSSCVSHVTAIACFRWAGDLWCCGGEGEP